MSETTPKSLANMFCEHHAIEMRSVGPDLRALIEGVVAPYYSLMSDITKSPIATSPDPIDGLLLKMVSRCFDVVEATLLLIALNKPQPAEALSRTTMESAVSALYIADANTASRFIQYFQSYLKQERNQNRQWLKSLAAVTEPWKEEHERRISSKNEFLDAYERLVAQFAMGVGETYPPERGWPKLYDICHALGKAIEYRTVYAAMSSQSHHDAEDILNSLGVEGMYPTESQVSILDHERDNFSYHLVIIAATYFLELISACADRFGMEQVKQRTAWSDGQLDRLLRKVAENDFVSYQREGMCQKSRT